MKKDEKNVVTKSKRFRFPLKIITVIAVVAAICGSVYAVYGNNVQYSAATTKQKFMIGIKNTLSSVGGKINQDKAIIKTPAISHYDPAKPTEANFTFKLGENTNIFTGSGLETITDYAINFIAKNDNVNNRVSYDLKLLKNDADLLTAQFYGDSSILALKSKELYPQFVTANNANLIQTFNNIGIAGFPFDSIDVSKLQLSVNTTVKDKLTALGDSLGAIFVDQLDATMFQKVTEVRTINSVPVSGDAITLEVNGTQLIAALKASINILKADTATKALIIDLYNNHLMSELGLTEEIDDADVTAFLNDLYMDMNDPDLAEYYSEYISKVKVQLFIVDLRSVQTTVEVSLADEYFGETVDFNATINEENSQYNFDLSLLVNQAGWMGSQILDLGLTGYVKNIDSIEVYQPSVDDVKLETADPTQLATVIGTGLTNFTTIAQGDPLLTYIMEYLAGSTSDFVDVNEETIPWAYDKIQMLYDYEIASGIEKDGELYFEPNRKITRAEAVAMVVNAYYYDESGSATTFNDVHPYDWYYKVIGIAYKNKIISGITKKNFAPNKPMKRQDMCILLVKAMISQEEISLISKNKINETLFMYTDQSRISAYAKRYVATAVSNGIMSGTMTKNGSMKLYPRNAATRAEAAVMVCNAMFGDMDYGMYFNNLSESNKNTLKALKNNLNFEKISSDLSKKLSGNKMFGSFEKRFSSLIPGK